MEAVEIRVFYAQHSKTGLWKAESPDIKGLLVFDRDLEALQAEIPDLVRALLEEDGKRVYKVAPLNANESEWQLPQNTTLARVEMQAA